MPAKDLLSKFKSPSTGGAPARLEDQAKNPAPAALDDDHLDERTHLFIVGQNIDSRRAWWHKNAENLVRVSEGVYIDASLSIEQRRQVLERHAIRIAKLARPDAVLCGASAYHLGAVGGHVSMTSEFGRKPRVIHANPGSEGTSIKCFDLLTYRAPWIHDAGTLAFQQVSIKDSMGEFQIRCFSPEMLLLESFGYFRTRPISTLLNPRDVSDITEAVLKKHGSLSAALDRIKNLADRIGARYQFKRLEEHMSRSAAYQQERRGVYEYMLLWNQSPVATLRFDGAGWTMEYERSCQISLTLNEHFARDQVPSFIASLLPERGMRARAALDDGFKEFQIADRYTSNITIRSLDKAMQKVIIDTLEGGLAQFVSPDLVFTGQVDESLFHSASSSEALSRCMRHRKSTRMSGVQVKVPCNLSSSGSLAVAHDKAFTHIAKVAPMSGEHSSLGSIEWFTMHMAACAGVQTERFVLADLGGSAPAFIAERFDIRKDRSDDAMILTEDLWSIMGMVRNDDKYDADLLAVGDIIRSNSTQPDVDARRLLRQVVFSWVAGNSDLHLKNLMLIKHANDEMTGFKSIRLSPAYDLVCTQVYPGDAETAALRIEGEAMYNVDLLRKFAKRMRIEKQECDDIIRDVIVRIGEALKPSLENLPDLIVAHERSLEHVHKAANIMASRSLDLVQQLDAVKQQARVRLGGAKSRQSMSFNGG